MKNSLLVKTNDLLQLPSESPQVRNSDETRDQASRDYFKPKPFLSTATPRCSPKFSNRICFPEADFKLSLTGNCAVLEAWHTATLQNKALAVIL